MASLGLAVVGGRLCAAGTALGWRRVCVLAAAAAPPGLRRRGRHRRQRREPRGDAVRRQCTPCRAPAAKPPITRVCAGTQLYVVSLLLSWVRNVQPRYAQFTIAHLGEEVRSNGCGDCCSCTSNLFPGKAVRVIFAARRRTALCRP